MDRDGGLQTTLGVDTLIQHLDIPLHVKASQGDTPICKGFGFVTFRDPACSEAFVQLWTWLGARSGSTIEGDDGEEHDNDVEDQLMNLDISKEDNDFRSMEDEAMKSGFRALTMYGYFLSDYVLL
jgi:hypothetical protein